MQGISSSRRTGTVRWLAGYLALAVITGAARAQEAVPTPEALLGFRPGADGRLVGWAQVVEYVRAVDRASDRVVVSELGQTTEGRPLIAAVVASASTLRDLEHFRGIQAKLADPRTLPDPDDAARAVAASKAVVVISCSIHSTETASTLMALELLHELATRDDPATREVLDNTILVLVPSANPDGVEKVARWYERTKGHPWEGDGMPELYHKYAGHDTNRDWFMLNLKETQLLSRLLYRTWFPTLLYDVHQMGRKGARLFVPPFHDPINPNLDARIHQGIFLVGAHMAADLAAAGKRGVLTGALYDNWWNGGNRTTPQRHNVVAVLTEAASVRMATPLFLEKADLTSGGRGFPDHNPSVNFVDPWPGGWWRLRDVVDYELICARSILTLAARYRATFQSNLLAMARDAIDAGATRPPFGWVVPSDQRDVGATVRMLQALQDTGVEVHKANASFACAGGNYPAGTWLIPAAQPYRAHVKDLMERQHYPDRLTAAGKAEPPYDVAGWTLPLQMGVRVVEAGTPLVVDASRVDRVEAPSGRVVPAVTDSKYFTLDMRTNDAFKLLNSWQIAGVEVYREGDGSILVKADATSRDVLDKVHPLASCTVAATSREPEWAQPGGPIKIEDPWAGHRSWPRRIAVYQPWVPSMDEGWTRLVLESFGFRFTTVHNDDIRAGQLHNRFDVLLIPSITPKILASGYAPEETEPAYVGGLSREGADALRAFLRDGGRIVCLDASCDYAIETFDLPVKNVLKGRPSSEFYAPGSLLRAVTAGTGYESSPQDLTVYVDQPPAFEVSEKAAARVLVRFATTNPLDSGWLLGPDKIAGKGALVSLEVGKGSVVLFAFRPQHRGQTFGTFRFLFESLALP